MIKPNLQALLHTLSTDVKATLESEIIVSTLDDPDLADVKGTGSRTWLKIPKVVAVVADLKNSSRLGTNKHDKSTARIYQAGVEGAVKALHEFGANFIDIQGDGGFGLFWGDLAFERAFCAAVTIRTFSDDFVKQLESAHKNRSHVLPETGYKVGIAVDRLMVKTIGTRRDVCEQEAVWPGRPVNHAAKCAQSADRHQIIATGPFWDYFKNNDYVVFSCCCSTDAVSSLWAPVTIEHIKDERYNDGYRLAAPWCVNCGPSFCDAIMAGLTVRDINEVTRRGPLVEQMRKALDSKNALRRRYPR